MIFFKKYSYKKERYGKPRFSVMTDEFLQIKSMVNKILANTTHHPSATMRASFIMNKVNAQYEIDGDELIYFCKFVINNMSVIDCARHCHTAHNESEEFRMAIEQATAFSTFPDEALIDHAFPDQMGRDYPSQPVEIRKYMEEEPPILITREEDKNPPPPFPDDIEIDYEGEYHEDITDDDIIKFGLPSC